MTNYQLTNHFNSPHGKAYFGVAGNGPAVILCHGTPVNSCIWECVINQLSADYTLHFLDLPGYGRSEKFDGQNVSLRAFAQTVSAFAKHLGLEKPHLVGHDFGAAAVLGAHLVEGLAVESITIANGVVLSPWGTPFSRHVKEHEEVFAGVPEYIHKAMLVAHLAQATSRTISPDLNHRLVDPWIGEVGQRAYYRQIGQYDYDYTTSLEKLYSDISVPLTVLWGEEDPWVDISEGKKFASLVPNSQFVPLPDAGHFSMIDTPMAFSNELLQALKSVSYQAETIP